MKGELDHRIWVGDRRVRDRIKENRDVLGRGSCTCKGPRSWPCYAWEMLRNLGVTDHRFLGANTG